MTTQSSRRALQLRLWALFMFFFIPGLLMASWATRTPAIRDILSVSIAEMGGVLFGLSIGSMSGILCSAWLVKRFGTRKVIRTTMSFAVLGMLVLSLALWVTSAPLFAFGLAIFGASFGSAEVAINVEGAAIEREMNKTVLPMMHGFYSLGTLAGAGIGMALTALGIPPETVPLMLIRPVSGSGALAVASDLMTTHGPDSYIGRVAAVMMGSTETTFYTIAVYFGSAGVVRTRHTVPAALAADFTGFLAAALTVRLFFGT